MKSKIIYPLLMLSLISFSPLALSADDNAPTTKEQKAEVKKNGEVIGWISAIDNFEVDASGIALKKDVDSDVKNYADMLHNDHSKNLTQLNDLSSQIGEKPVDSKSLDKFKKGGEKDLKKLNEADKDFQKVFIDMMVKGHEGALKKVDHDLLKMVSNDQLKTFVKETRDMIAHHLEVAKEIQKKMKK